ncbi:unnamed protein product [Victoria cruziana]
MTNAQYTTLPQWPNAYPASGACATLKLLNEDFIQLAEAAGVQDRDVGYAGLKDRYALTRQWFSIYLPKGDTPDLTQLQHPEFKVLSQSRHVKKLRPGDLQGNRFRIVLRDVNGDPGALEAIEVNLKAIAAHGVPNYFGAQRFGFDGGNVEQGRAMLAREIRVRNPKKKGIYLSAVRSFVFNEVLALRIQQGLWGQTLPGDVLDEAGRPTGPMPWRTAWRRGTPPCATAWNTPAWIRSAAPWWQARWTCHGNGRKPINWCSRSPCRQATTPRPS